MDKKVTKKEMASEIKSCIEKLGVNKGAKYYFVPPIEDNVNFIFSDKTISYKKEILWVSFTKISFISYTNGTKTDYTECSLTSKECTYSVLQRVWQTLRDCTK